MTKQSFKPTLQELAFVSWLLDAPEKRFALFYSDATLKLYDRVEQRPEDGLWTVARIYSKKPGRENADVVARFGGKIRLGYHDLAKAGIVVAYSAGRLTGDDRARYKEYLSDIFITGAWPDSAVLAFASATAREWWETVGRARYDLLLAKHLEKAAKAAEKERVAVFGRRENYPAGDYAGAFSGEKGRAAEAVSSASATVPKWQGIRPAFAAVVVRETETRFYVRDAVRLSDSYLGVQSTNGAVVEHWIDRKYLVLDHASPADIDRLKSFDKVVCGDYRSMRDRLVDEMVPALIKAMGETDQKSAEIDGTFADLLASLVRKPETNKGEDA